jgi:hypothetical protein
VNVPTKYKLYQEGDISKKPGFTTIIFTAGQNGESRFLSVTHPA